jgi:hypothetical protein
MFNKKIADVLCYIVAVLLILKVLFVLTMFVWGMIAGQPPVAIFAQGVTYGSFISLLLLLQELGASVFTYVIVIAVRSLSCCACSTKKK